MDFGPSQMESFGEVAVFRLISMKSSAKIALGLKATLLFLSWTITTPYFDRSTGSSSRPKQKGMSLSQEGILYVPMRKDKAAKT